MIQAIPLFVLLTATIVIELLLAPRVWLVVVTDGLFVAALIAAAAGWGCWPTVWLGLGRESTGRQFCLATALGFGIISTAVLVLGVTGRLNQATGWILLAIGGLFGLLRLSHPQLRNNLFQNDRADTKTQLLVGPIISRSLALLPLCVPLAVMLFGATLPPGLLWSGEARGYDVLEYHLQVPREYYQAGYIHFLPHNVYASFPQQIETLYLLLMHLCEGPYRAAIPAQLLHAACGLLTIIALMVWAKPGWARILVVLVAGSVPWLAYLGCLAYVELGALFFTAVATGLVLDHYRSESKLDWRPALAAGLCAGLAGGCKYTAVVLVAAALGITWAITMRVSPRARLARLSLFGVGTLLALSPWLIRNTAFTGNPVYPFAYQWFGGSDWSAEQDAQWTRGHQLPTEQDSLAGRIKIGVDELFSSQMFGSAVWLLPAAFLAFSPIRRNWLLVVWLVLIATIWASCTHMPGRFVVPIIVPLAMMLGELPKFSRRQWLGRYVGIRGLVGSFVQRRQATDTIERRKHSLATIYQHSTRLAGG